MEEFLQVGAIANTHGIAGEVKVFPMTDDIKRFKKLKEVYLDTGKERKLLHVVSCKFVKNQPVLRFKEFSNINEVEMYKRKGLFVTRDQAVPLEKDEYFIADLIGLSVIREDNGEVLGELTDVLQTGANDVYEVKLKKYFYVIRPILACKWILDKKTAPPMLFSELMNECLDDELTPEINRLLEIKKQTSELGKGKRIDVINDYIEKELAEIEKKADIIENEYNDWEILNKIFLEILEQ